MFFKYKCLNPSAPREIELDLRTFQREPSPPQASKYLPPFWHVKSKVVSINGGMGTGKTTQIIADKDHMKPKRALVITCRRGMATNMTGRFEGFTSYHDAINEDMQIIEYESLHRLNDQKYDMIILDEIRSTLNSAVCRETNGMYMNENMEKLQELIYMADRVVCADADLHIDGAVETFYAAVFEGEEIHRINHTGGGQELHAKWASDAAFLRKIQQGLRDGKRVGVCCGSAKELKALEKMALDIVGKDEVGIYYANSANQSELADVHAHWSKYKLIGFTSTITVSVDYTVPIDTVYISPLRKGCVQRDMNQMKSRFRVITSGLIVVKVTKSMLAPLEPLNADMSALHSEEMNRIMNRRTYITDQMSEWQRDLNRTIFKQGVGHKANFSPSLLTELWAWSNVERFLADFHWIQYLIQIFQAKGYTWSTCIDYVEDEKEKEELEADFGAKREAVKKEHTDRLEKVDVYEMTGEEFDKLVNKVRRGVGNEWDAAKIEKYKVQRCFDDKIDAQDVEEFNKFKLPIYTRGFHKAFPPVVRKRIDYTRQLMEASLDDFRPNYDLSEKILGTLELTGFNNMGGGEQEIDLQKMPEEAWKDLEETITAIRTANIVRGSEASDPIQAFSNYLRNLWGYKLKYHKRQKENKKYSTYSMLNAVPERLLANTLYSSKWLETHCKAVDKYFGHGHDEEKLIKPLMPMMLDMEKIKIKASPKRKRGD